MDLSQTRPLTIVHNRLTRMADQDVKFTKNKVKPENKKAKGARALADVDKVHERLFVKLEAGDGPKQSSI